MATLYQLTNNSLAANAQSVIRESDGATIPYAAGNADWQVYLLWLQAGNNPDPAPAPPTPPPIFLQIISTSYGSALSGTYRIDGPAQNQILSISAYILYNNRFPATSSDPTGATFPWLDANKGTHTFPNVTTFQNFASAVAAYVANYTISGTAGPQPVTIP